MTDSPAIDEPDLTTHICNVLDDLQNGVLDSRDEAVDAIMAHPTIQAALNMKAIKPHELSRP